MDVTNHYNEDYLKLLSNEIDIRGSGILGDEILTLLSNVILLIVGIATFLLIFLKTFVINNNDRYTEEEFKALIIKRTNSIENQQNFKKLTIENSRTYYFNT